MHQTFFHNNHVQIILYVLYSCFIQLTQVLIWVPAETEGYMHKYIRKTTYPHLWCLPSHMLSWLHDCFFSFFFYRIKLCDIFLVYFPEILGASCNCLIKVIMTTIHSLCFDQKLKINAYPCKPEFFLCKLGYEGTC